jgi:hypothetical protein
MKNRKWLFVAVLGVSFAGMPALVARAADTEVKMRDVPDRVKRKLEATSHDAVKTVTLTERAGHKYYRFVLDKKGPEDEVVRISPEGEVLGAEIERDVRAETKDEPGRARPAEARARAADASEGTVVKYDDLPGGIKSAIGSEARNQKIERVTTYAHRGTTIYRAVVGDGDRERVIRVTPDGKVYHEEDVTPEGGKVVEWDRLPAPAKSASGSEAGAAKVSKVYQFTRGDVTHYRVVLDSGKNFDVTDAGKIVQVDENGGGTATPDRRKR